MFSFESRGLGPSRIRKGGIAPGQRILVCGAHRSGTTLLGHLLSADQESLQLTEPFHPLVGMEGVDRWYIAADKPGERWNPLIDQLIAGSAISFAARDGDRPSLWARFRGTPRSREYSAVQRTPPGRLVIKDPFLSLSAQYLVRRHRFQVVFAVKHPAAFLLSLRRVGWDRSVPLDDLVAQRVIDAAQRDAARDPVSQAALLWNVVNRHALATARALPKNVSIWSHERFCADPDREMKQLTRALRISYSDTIRAEVAQATRGEVVTPPMETIHALVRNSAAMAGDWRERLPQAEQAALRQHCGAIYHELVGTAW